MKIKDICISLPYTMINLLDINGFDWDEGNQEKNTLKYKVTNKECEEIFKNNPLIVNYDNVHSTSEEGRFQVLGQTSVKRKLFISYTIRRSRPFICKHLY